MITSVAEHDEGARRSYGWLAAAALSLTLAVVMASAYLRHSQADAHCEPRPQCYARADVAAADVPGVFVRGARIVHRVSATAVVAAILGLLLVAWTQRPIWLREALVATAALALAGALALLGIATGGSRSAAVVLGNMLGGYLLVALMAAAWEFGRSSRSPGPGVRLVARVALALAFVVAALGGLLSAANVADGFDVSHRLATVALIALGMIVAYRIRHARSRLAIALSATLALAAALGVAVALVQPEPLLAVLHNASTAVAIALLATVSAQAR